MYRARFCRSLKGKCHGIFDFRFSTWISFPQAPDYSIGAVSNFFENSRRYSQLKVHHRCRWHRWQMEKIFNLHYFFWTPLGSRVSRRLSLIPAAILPPVSLIPVVHLDLRISPRIFENIRNGPNGIIRGWGILIHEKTRSKKSRDTVPLKKPRNRFGVKCSGQV